jgi:hypothetical protein
VTGVSIIIGLTPAETAVVKDIVSAIVGGPLAGEALSDVIVVPCSASKSSCNVKLKNVRIVSEIPIVPTMGYW